MIGVRGGAAAVAAVAAAGTLLLGAVVAGRLLGTSFRSDVAAICEAESRSGRRLDDDMAGVRSWLRDHLGTPRGNELYAAVTRLPIDARAARLRSEALAQGIPRCPTADSFDRLTRDAAYRSDLQHLCSALTFPGFVDLDDGARLDELRIWIAAERRSERSDALSTALHLAATPAARAELLRAAATSVDVYSCPIARLLEAPRPLPPDDASTPD